MLQFLYGKASGRKIRLLAIAFARRVEPFMTDGRSRASLEVSECIADGRASRKELRAAASAARTAAGARRPAACYPFRNATSEDGHADPLDRAEEAHPCHRLFPR